MTYHRNVLAAVGICVLIAASVQAQRPAGQPNTTIPEALTADPAHYTVEFENAEVRVLRIRYAPHAKGNMHDHPRSVTVFLTAGSIRATSRDGRTMTGSPRPGSVVWEEAGPHQIESVSDQPFEAIRTEFKTVQQPPVRNARPAVEVLGGDFTFPNRIAGMPARLSDVQGLAIGSFVTSDGVRLAYWEAGQGRPLIILPGWSRNGAHFVNLIHLLSRQYHVFVLDHRNQGLSQKVAYGTRIARYAKDVQEFAGHIGASQADFVGHSMGAAVLWSYLDQFGGAGIRKVVFVDEPVSIYAHSDWSEQERHDAGALVTSGEQLVAMLTGSPGAVAPPSASANAAPSPDFGALFGAPPSPYAENTDSLARAVVKDDLQSMGRVLFDHAMNDWRDVIRHKITIPAAIFSGEGSRNLPAQRWIHAVVPRTELHVYTKAEGGDHELISKNPVKFAADLVAFLERRPTDNPR